MQLIIIIFISYSLKVWLMNSSVSYRKGKLNKTYVDCIGQHQRPTPHFNVLNIKNTQKCALFIISTVNLAVSKSSRFYIPFGHLSVDNFLILLKTSQNDIKIGQFFFYEKYGPTVNPAMSKSWYFKCRFTVIGIASESFENEYILNNISDRCTDTLAVQKDI